MEEFQEWEKIEGTGNDVDSLEDGSGPSFIRQGRELCNDNKCLDEARAESLLAGLVHIKDTLARIQSRVTRSSWH
jgi:hypothetical protein